MAFGFTSVAQGILAAKRFRVAALLAGLNLPATLTAQTPADVVRSLDSAWARAYATHDTALALALFDADIVVTSGNGAVKNRAGEIGDVRSAPNFTLHFFRTSSVDVNVLGDKAVVTGNADWQWTFNGRTNDTHRWYVALYEKGGPLGWRITTLTLRVAPVAATAGHNAHKHPAGARILLQGTMAGEGGQPVLVGGDGTPYVLNAAPRSGLAPALKTLIGQSVRVDGTVYPAPPTYLIVVDSARVASPDR